MGDSGIDIEVRFCDFSRCAPDSDDELIIAVPVSKKLKVLEILLDSRKSWADEKSLGRFGYTGTMQNHIQLLQVILHQFGHGLGLNHSPRKSSIMRPFYEEWYPSPTPDPEDYAETLLALPAVSDLPVLSGAEQFRCVTLFPYSFFLLWGVQQLCRLFS